jgi:hypothetical protein
MRADRRELRFPCVGRTMAPNDRGRFDGTNYDLWDDRGVGTMDERPSPDLMEDPYDPLVARTVPFS